MPAFCRSTASIPYHAGNCDRNLRVSPGKQQKNAQQIRNFKQIRRTPSHSAGSGGMWVSRPTRCRSPATPHPALASPSGGGVTAVSRKAVTVGAQSARTPPETGGEKRAPSERPGTALCKPPAAPPCCGLSCFSRSFTFLSGSSQLRALPCRLQTLGGVPVFPGPALRMMAFLSRLLSLFFLSV